MIIAALLAVSLSGPLDMSGAGACSAAPNGYAARDMTMSYAAPSAAFRLRRVRGVSLCTGAGGAMTCDLIDPGVMDVRSGRRHVTYKLPARAFVRLTADKYAISCLQRPAPG
jgi:hypothetical protein